MLVFFSFLFYILLTLIASALIFPLPFSDTGNVRYSSLPYMTFLLIIVNSLLFMLFLGQDYYQGISLLQAGDFDGQQRIFEYVMTIWTYGYRASFLREGLSIGAMTTFTSMFMHADMWHLIGNMIYLWTFGRRIEDACGPWRYLLYYLLAGMVANLGSTLLNPSHTDLPGIGASGAIAGLMGAYLVLFPGKMVLSIWGVGSFLRTFVVGFLKLLGRPSVKDAPLSRRTIQLPAWFLLIFFLVRELIPSLETIQQGKEYGGVNNLAHVMGFLSAVAIFLFVRKDVWMRYFSGRQI